jgi:hypothetical protein
MNNTNLSEEQQWREAAARVMAIWRGQVGGTYDTLAVELSSLGRSIAPKGLAQNLRPRGRRPRSASDVLVAIAKVLTSKLSDRRPDMDPATFEDAMRKHIVGGARSPLEIPSEPVSTAPPRGAGLSPALFTFDLWTPGQSPEAIIREFAPFLGPVGAQAVSALSRDAIGAIGTGDFARQQQVAEEAIRLGEDAPKTPLRGEGLYLKAEALRLMADFKADRAEARRLRTEADGLYLEAEAVLRGDPRPIRGRARTMEVLGDLDVAAQEFERAIAAVDARRPFAKGGDQLSLAHEQVRSLRHKMSCLAAMHAQAPLATSEAQRRGEEIRRILMASEPQHRDALKLFEDNRDWWVIEWFMALVLHAKAWNAIKENGLAAKRLEWSLRLRLQMMPDDGPLTAVELGNLHWWSGVAHEARGAFESSQERALEVLNAALDRGDERRVIKALGQRFLSAGEAPWTSDDSRI